MEKDDCTKSMAEALQELEEDFKHQRGAFAMAPTPSPYIVSYQTKKEIDKALELGFTSDMNAYAWIVMLGFEDKVTFIGGR